MSKSNKGERKISIIIPAYNEADSLKQLYSEIVKNVNEIIITGKAGDYEIWFINDGSTDRTEGVIDELITVDSKVHIISFRKNFGKSPALESGFQHITGDIVFTLDADLQDDPSEMMNFIDVMDDGGWDMVVGWKYNRLDPLEKRLPSKIFNKVTSTVSKLELHDFDCGYKCFKCEVAEAIDLYGELHRYIPVLAFRAGFRITEKKVNHRKREHGRSKYGAERYMKGLLDSLTTTFLLKYSDRPMYLFGRMGIITTGIGVCICLFLSILWFMGQPIGGRPLLVLGVLLILVGFQMISTGLVCNLVIDKNYQYKENHIKRII